MKSGVGKWQGRGVFSGRYLNLSSGVWVSQNSRKTLQGVPATPKTNYPHYFSAAHVQDKNTRCPRIYLPLPCSGWSTVSPPCPTVPVSIMVDRQGIVTIPGLGRPSRRPLPSGAMTSPQGRPGMHFGTGDPHRPSRTLSCIWQSAMPKQQTICVLKHFIATTKTATSPESPTVTSP